MRDTEAKAVSRKPQIVSSERVERPPVVFTLPPGEAKQYPFYKRSIDVFGALVGLALLTPLIPLIGFAIKLNSPGPVFVALSRVSEGKVIRVYKFRSMILHAHRMKASLAMWNERKDGPLFKMKNDPRVTFVGKLLRKFRIDEFPQLLNVLKGELALVGPRPHEPVEVMHYPDEYTHILWARAGVTGASQVNGASSLSFLKELEFDSEYLKKQSLGTDLKILGKTARIIFTDPTAV